MPGCSPRRAGSARQRPMNSRSPDAEPRGQPTVRGHELLGRVRLVPGRDRRVRREDDTRAHGFERVLEATRRPRPPRAASSSAASAGWPSFRCRTAGSIPSARRTRTPPIPSRPYCASLTAGCTRTGVPSSTAARGRSPARRRRAAAAARGRRPRARPRTRAAPKRSDASSRSGDPSGRAPGPSAGSCGSLASQYSCCRPVTSSRWRK